MTLIQQLIDGMGDAEASDLHLRTGAAPRYRVHGEMRELSEFGPIDRDVLADDMQSLMSEDQEHRYRRDLVLHFSFGRDGLGRYRACFFNDRAGPAAVIRRLEPEIPTLGQLKLPARLEEIAHLQSGLVLVTGATGSGKSSTLAALIDVINSDYRKFIITLEDPIEYVYEPRKAIVHQRGLNYDITDYRSGLASAIAQSPDVLLVGELRDAETIRLALTAAEMGTLVFSTLHTNGAADSIDRMIDVFPAEDQSQVRVMVSQCITAIVSQVLLPRADGQGRVPATEVMMTNTAISNLIREGRVRDIQNCIQSGRDQGMHTLDESLEKLIKAKTISHEDASYFARNKERFERYRNPGSVGHPERWISDERERRQRSGKSP